MPILLQCHSCAMKMQTPDSSAGTQVMCPSCKTVLTVPGAKFEAVNTQSPKLARSVAKKKTTTVASKRQEAIDDDDDDDDDDIDDRMPKTKSKGSTGNMFSRKFLGMPLWISLSAGAVVMIAGVAIAGFLVSKLGPFSQSPAVALRTMRDPAGQFSMFFPVEPRKGGIQVNGRVLSDVEYVSWGCSLYSGYFDEFSPGISFYVESKPVPDKMSTEPDQLEKLIKAMNLRQWEDKEFEIVSRKSITLGGKPALEIRMRKHRERLENKPEPPPAVFQKREHVLVCVTTNGNRIILMHFHKNGPNWNEKEISFMYNSFVFVNP